MSAVELFTYEETAQIRTVTIDERRWAVAADICAAIDIRDVSAAIAKLDQRDKMVIRRSDTPGSNQGIWQQISPRVQSIGLVSEDGATDLVLESRKPEARRFRRFLTHEVWPAIRDTGSYSTVPTLTDDELIHRALEVSARRVAELTERVAELEPQAAVATKLLDAEGDLSVRDAATSLTRAGIKIGAGRLFAELERRGWIKRALGDGRYRVMQKAIETGYMSVLPQSHYHPKTGVLVLDPPQPRVTPKGLQRLLGDYDKGGSR
ncbi:BRO family, N-terminal domain protein [Mycobacterium parascrofulaceum ATCC BAA-614]|uniref:BRO family, N-terminal domain protein n=1 Tax=Mycobacterium parascrofulaceum ATCC BAA-614 TaxID=525368 RepID=D5PF98_9MYCO|nr:phage antirepressor KilAC domain-containing protein [Mycobacterium parascrofulaceum]EFG75279.1 BRO family, N-terminal domain protein [Mycobacterium parascrofulaceum ATCC BAA-614]